MNRSKTVRATDELVLACEDSPLVRACARLVAEQINVLDPKLGVEVRPFRRRNVGKRGWRSVPSYVRPLERRAADGVVVLVDTVTGDLPAGLELAAVPERLPPFQGLVSSDGTLLDELPRGARVGVRDELSRFQISGHRPDLTPVAARQSLAGCLRQVERGRLAAFIAPVAELEILGWQDIVNEVLDSNLFLPSPCRGAVALVCARENRRSQRWLKPLDDLNTRAAVEAERALAREMDTICGLLGALAQVSGSKLTLEGALWSTDGVEVVRDSVTGPVTSGLDLGKVLAERFYESGAGQLPLRSRRPNRSPERVPQSTTSGE